jgi:Papain-like cysteine protease AvrRpt2
VPAIPQGLETDDEFGVGFEYADIDLAEPNVFGRHWMLTFAIERQQLPHWCWSAAAVSIARYYGRGTTPFDQCGLAKRVLNCECSCDPPEERCDGEARLYDALEIVGHEGETYHGALDFEEILEQLRNDHPIGCCIAWDDGDDKHDVVICGAFQAADGTQHVQVADPMAPGHVRTMPLDVFTTSFRNRGRWVFTWRTRGSRDAAGV